jgi:hypothetical protein
MAIQKSKHKWVRRHTIGLWAYLFPTWVPSRFDLEAPFTLEETRRRLTRLANLRASRAPSGWHVLLSVLFGRMINEPTEVTVTPLQVQMDRRDPDTYRYDLQLEQRGFNIAVQGYVKRWEAGSTLVTGKIFFDLHYSTVLIKSLLFAAGLAAALTLAAYMLQIFLWSPLAAQILAVMTRSASLPWMLALIWLTTLVLLWLNDVVFPAHSRRGELLMRIEDKLLLPYLD